MCNSLANEGYNIVLLGRKLPSSKDINDRNYKTIRFKLPFTAGALFYASLNIRLFFYLLLHKSDVLYANDLDTLLPNYLVSKIKKIPLIYDSHEYFTEVPEIQGRWVKKVWKSIEGHIFPKLKHIITVNKSIADIYSKKYNVDVKVIKNLPNKLENFTPLSKKDLGIDIIGKYIILQGAGINVDRGAEELVKAMLEVNNVKLLIIGSGDVVSELKLEVKNGNYNNKIIFIDKQSPEKLKSYTYYAELGLSLDKDTNLNYKYSLPNKIFDYINLSVPVLVSDLVEVSRIVNVYNVGTIIPEHNPKEITKGINSMIENNAKEKLQENLKNAAKELNWEQQEFVIKEILTNI